MVDAEEEREEPVKGNSCRYSPEHSLSACSFSDHEALFHLLFSPLDHQSFPTMHIILIHSIILSCLRV